MTDASDARLLELSRSAAKAEPAYWTEIDGERVLTDREGRPPDQIRAELTLAMDLAEQLTAIGETVSTGLTPGRVFGPQLLRRLRTSAETLLRAAERDVRIVAGLEQFLEELAAREEKQAAREAKRR